jgi:D-glycero-beta-D-manno-heptose-7-phosphate kinase
MSAKINFRQILDNFKTKKILIVGDVMVDEYLWGSVHRISPEAPVPVVSCTEREYRMGGAANVAINIQSLGADPIMCSVIGDDPIGKIYKKMIGDLQMNDKGIIESGNRKTTVKTRIIGNHQHLLRIDEEITTFLDSNLEQMLLRRIKEILDNSGIDAVIFQDYDKGVLTPSIIRDVTEHVNKKSIPILVDPKKRNFLGYRDVSLFKPNFKEFIEGLNLTVQKNDYESIFIATQQLHRGKNIKNVMITLSEKGVFVSNGKEYKVLPAEERDIADVSGAGDTVICITALAIASGLDAFESAALANLAGGLVCEKIGVVPITPEMLLNQEDDDL